MYSPHHVALSVTNRERSLEFYGLLDFEEVLTWQAEDGSLTITHLKNSDSNFILELFCYKNFTSAPSSIHKTATDLPVIGTKHLGLRVGSIEAARADLARKRVIDESIEITQGRTGPRYFFVEDPDGILIEVSEDKREFVN